MHPIRWPNHSPQARMGPQSLSKSQALATPTRSGRYVRVSNHLSGAGKLDGLTSSDCGLRTIMYGIRTPPPTKNTAAQKGYGVIRWRSFFCSSKRDHTVGSIRKLFKSSEENPRPDPTGEAVAMKGFSKVEMSSPSARAKQRESGQYLGLANTKR